MISPSVNIGAARPTDAPAAEMASGSNEKSPSESVAPSETMPLPKVALRDVTTMPSVSTVAARRLEIDRDATRSVAMHGERQHGKISAQDAPLRFEGDVASSRARSGGKA